MRDRIEIVNPPANTPADLLNARGSFALDLLPDFTFQLTEKVEELNDINQIEGTAVLGFDLPMTARNEWLFQDFLSPNVIDNTFPSYEVKLITAGGTVLPQNQMWTIGVRDDQNVISVEVIRGEDFWGKQAQALALNEIDYGTMPIDFASVIANFQNYFWVEGRLPYWLPIVHRGAFALNDEEFVTEDLLPLLSVPFILKRGFQKLNWGFVAPILTNDWFSRLWAYVLKEDIAYTGQGSKYVVSATTSSSIVGFFITIFGSDPEFFVFDNVSSDAGANLQSVTALGNPATAYVLSQQVSAVIRFFVSFTIRSDVGGDAEIEAVFFDNSEEEIISTYNFTLASGQTLDVSFSEEVTATPGQEICLYFRIVSALTNIQATVLAGASITSEMATSRIFRDDTVTLSEIVSPDYTFLDFLKGIAHIGDFKFKTNWNTRTVSMYPAAETDVFGSTEEGFLLGYDAAVDMTEFVQVRSRQITFPRERQNRYIRFQFARSDDERIKQLKLPEGQPLHGRTIDLGDAFRLETKTSENPFFEPTANVSYRNLSLPALWGSDRGGSKIGPRILYGVGYIDQVEPTANSPILWKFQGSYFNAMGYAAQLPEAKVRPAGGGASYLPTANVVFGYQSEDLYSVFYSTLINDQRLSPTYEFLALLDQALFDDLDFRKRLYIRYGGEGFFAKLLEKRDFRSNENLTTPIVVKPDFQISNPADPGGGGGGGDPEEASYRLLAYTSDSYELNQDLPPATSQIDLEFPIITEDPGGNSYSDINFYGQPYTYYQPASATPVSVQFKLIVNVESIDATEAVIQIFDHATAMVKYSETFALTGSGFIDLLTMTRSFAVSSANKLGWRIKTSGATSFYVNVGAEWEVNQL